MTIRCIAFDLDDTLWDCHPVIAKAEQRFYDWLAKHYPRITQTYSAEELVKYRMNFMQQHPELHYNLTQLRKNWIANLATEHGYDTDMVDTGFEVFWTARNEVEFFEGTLDALHELNQDYLLGVITNGNASVDYIGIGDLFQFKMSSAQAGAAKPHPTIFHQALAQVGILPEQAVYVGDDIEKDVIGAKQAGLRAIWFNPKGLAWPGGFEPDAVIKHITEIKTVIPLL